jgi:ubiquinone/menaquinone biosynthesis C-methylase UbiE
LGSGEQLLFKNSTFDYVAIIITLCFVQNPQKVLRESGRVLKEKGKVIVGIIDKNSFLGKNYQKKRGVFYKKAKFFNVKEITGLLENAGFFNFYYYQTLFDLPGKIKSIQEPKKGFGKGGFIIISGEKK